MCSISFNDKPYQEINLKKILSDLHVSRVILFHFTWLCSLSFYIFWPLKIMSDLNTSHGKMSDFVSFPLFGFTLVIKLRNFDFERHWNALIYFDKKKRYTVRFKYVPWKDVWFCFISLFWFTLVTKLRNFNFKGHQNTLTFFNKKMMSDLIMSCQKVSDLI